MSSFEVYQGGLFLHCEFVGEHSKGQKTVAEQPESERIRTWLCTVSATFHHKWVIRLLNHFYFPSALMVQEGASITVKDRGFGGTVSLPEAKPVTIKP